MAYTKEIYKPSQLKFMGLKRKISPETENSLLDVTNKNYDLRNVSILKRKRNFTDHYGSDSRSTLAPKKLELISNSFDKCP